MEPTKWISRIGVLFLAGGVVCFSLVSGLLSTPRERFMAGIGLAVFVAGFWLLAVASYRSTRGMKRFPAWALVLAILGSVTLGLSLFSPCSFLGPSR